MTGTALTAEEPRRTDPRSFAVRAVGLLGQLGLPMVVAAATIFDKGKFTALAFAIPVLLAVLGINFALAYLSWRRFTYQVGAADIRVERGIVSRTARSVPFERVQDVSLEQKPIPRLFGLVEVRFETGAGGKDELKLAYLPEAEGERLRELVRNRRDGVGEAEGPAAPPASAPAQTLFAMSPRRVLTFGLFEFSLAVVAVVAGAAQQFDFLLPFDLWDFGAWQDRLVGPGHWLAELGFAAQIAGAIFALATLAVVGFGTGLVRTALREWDFRLERTEKGLRRRRGLLTRTDLVMPVHRVQALKIGTGLFRRRFGWHSLSIVSLAQDSGSANHKAAPFAQMEEIEPIVAETGFDSPDTSLDWERGSRRAHRDRSAVAAALAGGASALVAAFSPFVLLALVPLAVGAIVVLRETFLWHFDRHAISDTQIFSRHGWLAPKTTIGSRVKLQSVEIRQGPIAYWRGYATLALGLAGGKFSLGPIPVDTARHMRSAILDSIARRDFSDLL